MLHHILTGDVGKGHVSELDPTLNPRQVDRRRWIPDIRLGIEQLKDPRRGSHRREHLIVQHSQAANRLKEAKQVKDKGD